MYNYIGLNLSLGMQVNAAILVPVFLIPEYGLQVA
jgi:hypothetical protein